MVTQPGDPIPSPVSPALKLDPRFESYATPKKHLTLLRDCLAGLIVAMVAIPLGIGFAIASGLKPEQGIVAGGLAGILGALFGGSKYQIYGPTAAFIPLLSNMMAQYNLPFLVLASMLAGLVILLMGFFRLGAYFAKVPFSVTVGFTIGIALSIALGQLPDALGSTVPLPHHVLGKLFAVGGLLTHPNWGAVWIAVLTFILIRLCYKTSVFIPGPLLAMALAVLIQHQWTLPVPLLGDKFAALSGSFFQVTWPSLGDYPWWTLVMPVISIVFIASLESMLSAQMADRMAGNPTPFEPNQELAGQGMINTVVPLFNGFPCTGAFARTATSIKAGATSPVASLVTGVSILVLMVYFAAYMEIIPMACISGLLIYVASNMIKVTEIRFVMKHGQFHIFLMGYTAVITFLADLMIAVASATLIYYLSTHWKTPLKVKAGIFTLALLCWMQPVLAEPLSPQQALEMLVEGNQRFYQSHTIHPHQTHEQLLVVSQEQHPFVVVLTCADSRVPPEIIFDQGLGDIFDVRVAGNVLDPVVLGSLEYAVEHLQVPLVLVMGHERCGAILAALAHEHPHNHINSILCKLAPTVKGSGDSTEAAVKNNVNHVLAQLNRSEFFQKYLASGKIQLVGGYYHMETGQVELLPVPSL